MGFTVTEVTFDLHRPDHLAPRWVTTAGPRRRPGGRARGRGDSRRSPPAATAPASRLADGRGVGVRRRLPRGRPGARLRERRQRRGRRPPGGRVRRPLHPRSPPAARPSPDDSTARSPPWPTTTATTRSSPASWRRTAGPGTWPWRSPPAGARRAFSRAWPPLASSGCAPWRSPGAAGGLLVTADQVLAVPVRPHRPDPGAAPDVVPPLRRGRRGRAVLLSGTRSKRRLHRWRRVRYVAAHTRQSARRPHMRRAAGYVLVGLGVFLLALAPLAKWYVAPRVAVAPIGCTGGLRHLPGPRQPLTVRRAWRSRCSTRRR